MLDIIQNIADCICDVFGCNPDAITELQLIHKNLTYSILTTPWVFNYDMNLSPAIPSVVASRMDKENCIYSSYKKLVFEKTGFGEHYKKMRKVAVMKV